MGSIGGTPVTEPERANEAAKGRGYQLESKAIEPPSSTPSDPRSRIPALTATRAAATTRANQPAASSSPLSVRRYRVRASAPAVISDALSSSPNPLRSPNRPRASARTTASEIPRTASARRAGAPDQAGASTRRIRQAATQTSATKMRTQIADGGAPRKLMGGTLGGLRGPRRERI